MFLRLKLSKNRHVVVGIVYRPPRCVNPTHKARISSALTAIRTEYPRDRLYLCGDFNINLLDSGPSSATRDLISELGEHDLKQLLT